MERVACELCGSVSSQVVLRQRDLLYRVSDEEFAVVRCDACGLLYLNPRPAPGEIGRYYPEQYYAPSPTKSRTGLERQLKKLSRTIKRWIREDYYGYPSLTAGPLWRGMRRAILWPERARRWLVGRDTLPWRGKGRLLDVGCGPGVNLKTFQEQGWEVYGIDLSETAAARARHVVGDRIHCGTLETAPFPDDMFDVVVLNHSLEHVYSPLETLEKVRRLLQADGVVVIGVPNVDSLEARLFGQWWIAWDPPRHLFHFGKTTLTRLLEQAGFEVAQLRTGFGSYFFMVSLERAWASRRSGKLPARKLIEKVMARPLCLLAGHLGYGTEVNLYATKKAEA